MPNESSNEFQALTRLLDEALERGDLVHAKEILNEQSQDLPEWETNLLRARLAMAAECDDEAIGLFRSCMSVSADKTQVALRELAERETGSVGLKFLEILHELTPSEKQTKVQEEISAYRSKHAIGQLWSFFAQDQSLILESSSLDDIQRELLSGTIKRDMTCQKNHVGPRRSVEECLSDDSPKLELLLRPVRYYSIRWGGSMAVLGFLGSTAYSFYNIAGLWHIGFMKALFFGVCYVVLIVALIRGRVLLGLIAGFIGALLSKSHLSGPLAMLGFVLGNLLSNALAALAMGLTGAAVGAVIGLCRRPFLPKIPQAQPA